MNASGLPARPRGLEDERPSIRIMTANIVRSRLTLCAMAGLDPAIHVAPPRRRTCQSFGFISSSLFRRDDGPVKPGHDGFGAGWVRAGSEWNEYFAVTPVTDGIDTVFTATCRRRYCAAYYSAPDLIRIVTKMINVCSVTPPRSAPRSVRGDPWPCPAVACLWPCKGVYAAPRRRRTRFPAPCRYWPRARRVCRTPACR